MATSGKRVLTASGKAGIRSTGKSAIFNSNGECAECCGGCEYCSGATPKTFEVVFSGISVGCCGQAGGPTSKKLTNAAQINTTFIATNLEASGSPCVWYKSVVNAASVNYYSNLNCVTFSYSSNTSLYISLEKTAAGAWRLTMHTSYDPSIGRNYIFFSEIAGEAADCGGPLSFTNDLVGCGGINVGIGGTATVTIP